MNIFYKATDTADELIRGWMAYHQLFERTGIPIERVVRIMDKSDKRDKTGHLDQSSQTHYGTSVVVDDRAQVVVQFVDKMLAQPAKRRIKHIFLFRARPQELAHFGSVALRHVHNVRSWSQIMWALDWNY